MISFASRAFKIERVATSPSDISSRSNARALLNPRTVVCSPSAERIWRMRARLAWNDFTAFALAGLRDRGTTNKLPFGLLFRSGGEIGAVD